MPDKAYHELFWGADVADVDPDLGHIIRLEEERQARRIILIPSESFCPLPVRQALGSVFNNIYAEGYPPSRMCQDDEELLLDFDHQLAYYRRYADRRFYKGADYVHFVETLAQRRCAALFANDQVPAERIFVNVQALSGAAANLAVYDAFLEPGDTLMGMDLFQGGHLTHGSEFNISGRRYHVVSYGVDRRTERLDYDQIMQLALEHRPRLIIAGYTSYPWAPDWQKFRQIADAVGAYLLADIAHTAGLVVGGVHPNPVGIADVITFTTHKTICGPRGAVIMTTDAEKAEQIDAAVFPGAQGGPHTNKFAAMAVAFHIARSEAFRQLQQGIVQNAQALGASLQKRGIPLVYGGTDTHLLMVDLRNMTGRFGFPLLGEIVVRILELCGIIANKNTVPGDEATATARGVRLGTPWVTQRGMGPAEMDIIADCIAQVITNIEPFTYEGLIGTLPRGKIDLDVLEEVKRKVAALAAATPAEVSPMGSGYPHYFIMPENPGDGEGRRVLAISGWRAQPFLQQVSTNDVARLAVGEHERTLLLDREGKLMDDAFVQRLEPDGRGRDRFLLAVHNARAERVKAWLRGLADGYVLFDPEDIFAKVEGPAVVVDLGNEERGTGQRGARGELTAAAEAFLDSIAGEDLPLSGDSSDRKALYAAHGELFRLTKPYFVGQKSLVELTPRDERPEFRWQEPADAPLKRTPLYEWHRQHSRKIIPFAGWEMPVWYTSVSEEHTAVRQAAGLFDVAHMGVFEIAGPHAASFLDLVLSNYVRWFDPGQSFYAYLLDPDGNVIDDLMVYCRAPDLYLMVVNAVNEDKDWAWLNAVNDGGVLLDRRRRIEPEGRAILRHLKDPASGERQRVDLALQGPASMRVLQRLADDATTAAALGRLPRTFLMEGRFAGLDLIVARTGYTGEEVGYELFVHPEQAVTLWKRILEAGHDLGVQPTALGARDSTRTEAGLPLYGHELAGPFHINPIEAGFSSYVKLHKPYFIGRQALVEKGYNTGKAVIRFRMREKGVRVPKTGDPVTDKRGQVIGYVTSCSLDSEGYLLGLAYVEKRYNRPGTPIAIFNLPSRPQPEKSPQELQPGDRVLLHDEAVVLSRFPVKKRGRPVDWLGLPG
ncbi:MAG: glycine cleavage system aminomethyltransferase GcvT [Anaerolineae bacterium]|nr:glycine cleavage system aminomethyltransferase GcvT [Anaerolineae bacterium]